MRWFGISPADFIDAELAGLTAIPVPLLRYAGLSLFPIAAFIAFVGARDSLVPPAVWVVITGNAMWVAGSVLAELEYFGLRQTMAATQ